MKSRAILIVAVLAASVLTPAAPARAAGRASINAYRGLGAWVDIYDAAAWRNPGKVVARLADRGVRTLYLETNNYHSPGRIRYPKATGKFIDAAHARGLDIVAWYLPGFKKMKKDRRRAMAAIRFRSATGQRFDSFALDIESSLVKKVSKRTRRVLKLSSWLRGKVGSRYPLGAIIPSPRGMQLSPRYWPGFPYRELTRWYDVFLTMTYYSYRTAGADEVTKYMRKSMNILRAKTGVGDLPIHAIGGLANQSSRSETRAFVGVAREYGLIGASLYDESITGAEDWDELARIQPNPRQRPAMPFTPGVHISAYGKVPGDDETHPDEVVYRVGGHPGDFHITYEGFDLGAGEVELHVNWQPVVTLPAGPPGAWGTPTPLVIPDSVMDDDRANVVAFVPTLRHPNWPTWGVRGVAIQALGP